MKMNKPGFYERHLEHELDKPVSEYTEEEIRLLKEDYLKVDSMTASCFLLRRGIEFDDEIEMSDKLFEIMTEDEKWFLLRRKHEEDQPVFELVEDDKEE